MLAFQYFIVCLCLTLYTCKAQDTSLDDLIADIFTKDDAAFSSTPPPKTTNPPPPQPKNTPSPDPTKYESCGDQKECVPRFLCSNDTINTSGENIIDIRIDTGSPCKYLTTCCDIPNKVFFS